MVWLWVWISTTQTHCKMLNTPTYLWLMHQSCLVVILLKLWSSLCHRKGSCEEIGKFATIKGQHWVDTVRVCKAFQDSRKDPQGNGTRIPQWLGPNQHLNWTGSQRVLERCKKQWVKLFVYMIQLHQLHFHVRKALIIVSFPFYLFSISCYFRKNLYSIGNLAENMPTLSFIFWQKRTHFWPEQI